MIYLIRSFLRGGKSILKVGYSGDLKQRMSGYYHSNPGFELLATREGSLEDEKKLQLYIEALGYKLPILDEWFQDSPAVLTLFHEARDKMERTIWKHRETLFRPSDFKKGADIRLKAIYENLRMFYYYLLPRSKRNQGIDREYERIKAWERYKAFKESDFLMYE